jgi:heat shock protein HslJ
MDMKIARIVFCTFILAACLMPAVSCQEIGSPVEGFNWLLVKYGDIGSLKTVIEGCEVTAYFDKPTQTVSGNGGVNGYSATYKVEGLTLLISNLASTEMSGGPDKDAQEGAYFSILKSATEFEMDHGQLVIKSGNARLYFNQTDKPVKTVTHWGE